MKVTLLDYTFNAEYKMIFTKSTRLNMVPNLMLDILKMSDQEVEEELEYISNTIPSSWEFASYTFLIEGVSRAFTHQLVRNRQGSYAQQTMRVLDVSGFKYITGPSILNNSTGQVLYDQAMETIQKTYDELIRLGVAVEDARGILPTNICTNIVAKFNLRTLSELMMVRSSSRTQQEYRAVINDMYDCIIDIQPWAHVFLHSKKKQAADELDSFFVAHGGEDTTQLIKKLDILRK